MVKGTYSINITGEDWGCGTDKVIISFNDVLDKVTIDDFKVTETKQVVDWSDNTFPILEKTVDRKIINAYLCDENGNRTNKRSSYVALELYISPTVGSPLLFSMKTQLNTWSNPYYLTITLNESANLISDGKKVNLIEIDKTMINKTTSADIFKISSFISSDCINYNYAYYTPQQDVETLVVWLHGLGEGGTVNTDPYVSVLANKVTALTSYKIQSILGGAHILVPQCPTYWMDNDGQKTNFNNGAIIAGKTSYYTQSLIELIDYYKEKCNASKVVITGCSNGGYMTMLLALNNKYDAYVPICEALPDNLITDEQIQILKDLPMYFIYSKDDKVVDPMKHEIPTIQRLKDANATHLYVSTTSHVLDTSNKYKDQEGNAYMYNGHWSWIYFFNNETKDISVFNWIAEVIS